MSYLAQAILAKYSFEAAELWTQLENAQTPEEEEETIKALWENQKNQEISTDTQAELAEELDAEIAGIKARLEHLVEIHKTALDRLQRWRQRLDETLLYFHSTGVLPDKLAGKSRHITIKENPPSCEILIPTEELPQEYINRKEVVTPDKRRIIADWKKGIPVDGTHIERKRKVEYGIIPKNIQDVQDNHQKRNGKKKADAVK
ncbi:MAG: siphovirus Gp157 family protein [Rhizonema sp. PD38]|nr:siphovirus Gp157 family protein [Rhizonema sp. PD38]